MKLRSQLAAERKAWEWNLDNAKRQLAAAQAAIEELRSIAHTLSNESGNFPAWRVEKVLESQGRTALDAAITAAQQPLVEQIAAMEAAWPVESDAWKALREISEGANSNRGRCMDCDSIAQIADKLLAKVEEGK